MLTEPHKQLSRRPRSIRSKVALDKIIKKSRAHLYKPIQIAEILYQHRMGNMPDITILESYRNPSKKWRDKISQRLVGNVSTSSQKFQDNVFEANAMPPHLLSELAEFNKKNGGMVENYIYHHLYKRLSSIHEAYDYLSSTELDDFDLNAFLSLFVHVSGLKRSIDKAYEITVYALFSTIVSALEIEVSMDIRKIDDDILGDFNDFINKVLGLSKDRTSISLPAKLFRVGVTNAADRGLDMWTNFGPAIQVKHVSLNLDIAQDVANDIPADRIIIVCRDADVQIIKRIMQQLPFSHRIQGIITISDLLRWYEICFSKKYQKTLGAQIIKDFINEFNSEFPSMSEIVPFLKERHYSIKDLEGDWQV